jgi:predicted lipid-binding transport protein (Tim44 family)
MVQEVLMKQRMQADRKNGNDDRNGNMMVKEKPINAEIISVAETLLEPNSKEIVKQLQKSEDFNLDDFINKAKKAFSIINIASSSGDSETLTHLLNDQLFANFIAKINERKFKNHVVEHNIINIKSLDILSIKKEQNNVLIQLRICSDQGFWVKDENGKVIEGKEGIIITTNDIWTFIKPLGAEHKIWLLTQIEDAKNAVKNNE